ncbi:MAG: hypothetical protein PF961_23700 [Planctomycetota bacterium]|jgi:hypothetical protein|nr:hypothetical protein [Planctomycetota bacterium]
MVLVALQHSWLAPAPSAPDLMLALLAHVWLKGVEQRAILRAWWLGLLTDTADPSSGLFHTLSFMAAGVVYVPLARLLPKDWIGRVVLAALLCIFVRVSDGFAGGWAGFSAGAMMVSALWSSAACALLAWLLDGLPESLRPVAERERRPLTRLSMTL